MSDFRCPRYWWDGNNWRCQNLPNDYLDVHDYDTYCTNKSRCLECPYMDSEIREKVAAHKEKVKERAEEIESDYDESDHTDEGNSSSNDRSSSQESYSSNSSSDTGCLGSLFSLIGFLLIGILKLFFYFYKFTFLYLMFPIYVSVTLYYYPLFIVLGPVLQSDFLMLPLAIIATALFLSSVPYWVILFTQKHKRKMKWKQFFKYCGLWFIKGPFAYKDIIKLKNSPFI